MDRLQQVAVLLRRHFPEWPHTVQELKDITRNGGAILTHMVDDEVAGYLLLNRRPHRDDMFERHKNCIYLTYMGVKNKYRRQGIGMGLVLDAVRWANGLTIYTYVAAWNVKELNLLTKCGFSVNAEKFEQNQSWQELKYA